MCPPTRPAASKRSPTWMRQALSLFLDRPRCSTCRHRSYRSLPGHRFSICVRRDTGGWGGGGVRGAAEGIVHAPRGWGGVEGGGGRGGSGHGGGTAWREARHKSRARQSTPSSPLLPQQGSTPNRAKGPWQRGPGDVPGPRRPTRGTGWAARSARARIGTSPPQSCCASRVPWRAPARGCPLPPSPRTRRLEPRCWSLGRCLPAGTRQGRGGRTSWGLCAAGTERGWPGWVGRVQNCRGSWRWQAGGSWQWQVLVTRATWRAAFTQTARSWKRRVPAAHLSAPRTARGGRVGGKPARRAPP
jgi:hypothetical protein